MHDHNTQVRQYGRCETCADAGPNLTQLANPAQAVAAAHRPAPHSGGGAAPDPERCTGADWFCPSCDAGLPTSCTCPELTPEQAQADAALVAEGRALFAEADPPPATDAWHQLHRPVTIRDRHLAELVAEYPDAGNADHDPEHPLLGDWLLIERYVGTSAEIWFTTHPTPEAAATYHDTHFHAEDWRVLHLVNLLTGERYEGETVATYTTTWQGLP